METSATADARIACAHDGAPLARFCTVERGEGNDASTLTLRNPDGGFHRLAITHDGRGVVAADGAQPAVVTPVGPALIEVRIGEDRYRLPATVGRLRA